MANRLRFDTGTRNRPGGGMRATESYASSSEVESDPCPARRRRGKRALLSWHGLGIFAGVGHTGAQRVFFGGWGYGTIPPTTCVR